MQEEKKEIAKNNGKMTINSYIESIKPSILAVLPKHLEPERVLKVFLTEMRKNPALKQCTPESLCNALMQSAQDGLEFGTNRCYLIPYKNKRQGTVEATYMRSYLGIVDLARRSGCLKKLGAGVVYENDHFEIKRGFEEVLTHIPCMTSEERGQLLGAYSYAELADGQRVSEYMTKKELDSIKKRSKAVQSGLPSPWSTDEAEMQKKTVIKRMLKLLPMSAEFFNSLQLEDELEFSPPKPVKVSSDLNNLINQEPEQPPVDSYETECIEAEEE
jgi:recombination protein RecT